ncbi:hypothetical protein P3W55_29510 [Pseudomonas citronellolis]|uniref:DUF695 domain-containing protein n=1 Tax=Pseudomonas citronellolis TaxID=53408 RepID=A0AAW6PE86_9PSED|nr:MULTISPECIES: hypothetical protein [Pseudomonas]MDF3845865.1 hypothetical protein [Pseudomonas citronellolis]
MSFATNKSSTIAMIFALTGLATWAYFEYRAMTSIFKKDLGNGVVIYADNYVESGEWIFDCKYQRLISRIPVPLPFDHLKNDTPLKPISAFPLSTSDRAEAKELIRKLIRESGWYHDLHYLFSSLNDSSQLTQHSFQMLTAHGGRTWVVHLIQGLENEEWSRFYIAATPYDPETFVDYEKAMQQAKASCPTPQ